jgi:hypothetical protein
MVCVMNDREKHELDKKEKGRKGQAKCFVPAV